MTLEPIKVVMVIQPEHDRKMDKGSGSGKKF